MSELKAHNINDLSLHDIANCEFYLKSEADKVIEKIKNEIAPKQSDKTLQERLNEVCENHGVSTLQDLDWAFCMTEARIEDYTKLLISRQKALDKMLQYKVLYKELCRDINNQERHFAKQLYHQKYKRCLAIAMWCERKRIDAADYRIPRKKWEFYDKWYKRWLKIADQFKEDK